MQHNKLLLKGFKLFVGFYLSLINPSCNTSPSNSKPASNPAVTYEPVSIIRLISTPEKYDRKKVLIKGFLNLEYENDVVYLHREDYENNIGENSIGIIIKGEERSSPQYQKLNHKYVFVEGIFDKDQQGMLGFRGAIDSISRLNVEFNTQPNRP